MNRYFIASTTAFGVPSLILWVLLPIRSIQSILWISAFLLFVIGDSITTSLIKRYDDLEEIGLATRYICGRNPSSICAFGTRVLFFSLSLLAYLIVAQARVGAQYEMIMLTAVMLPLVLTIASGVIFINNSYRIFIQEVAQRSGSA